MTVLFGPLGPSLAPQVRKSATLYRWFKPFALWYANIAGYRKIGLKYDDLRESQLILVITVLLTIRHSP